MPRSSLTVFASLLLGLTVLALPPGATATSGIASRSGQQFLLNGAPYRAGYPLLQNSMVSGRRV